MQAIAVAEKFVDNLQIHRRSVGEKGPRAVRLQKTVFG